jgi:hypothetical protein
MTADFHHGIADVHQLSRLGMTPSHRAGRPDLQRSWRQANKSHPERFLRERAVDSCCVAQIAIRDALDASACSRLLLQQLGRKQSTEPNDTPEVIEMHSWNRLVGLGRRVAELTE